MKLIICYCSIAAIMLFEFASLQIIPPQIGQKVLDGIKSSGIDISNIQERVHDFTQEWQKFKESFNKSYSILGESARKMTWQDNFLRVIKHNEEARLGLHSYTLKVNHLADMTLKDYLQSLIRLLKSMKRKGEEDLLGVPFHNASQIPEELDWREKGFNGKVWNQLDCGSCYAFTVVSIVEGQIFKKTGELKYLSTQQVLDCSKSAGNMGCRGGSLRNTLRYVEQNGLIDQSIYPYSAKEATCHYQKTVALYRIKSWNVLPSKDEEALKIALATVGPIAVSINASPSTFQLYQLQRFEKTNEMLLNCNSLSVNRLKVASAELKKHTQLLVEIRKDLDGVFKRVRNLKTKLGDQYPDAFAAATRSIVNEEDDEMSEAIASSLRKPKLSKSAEVVSSTSTQVPAQDDSADGSGLQKEDINESPIKRMANSSSDDSENSNNDSSPYTSDTG